jgi:hypothetical protein
VIARKRFGVIGQVAFVAGLLVIGSAVAAIGGGLLLNSAGLAASSAPEPTSSCPMRHGCTTMTVGEVSDDAHLTMSEGSTVVWAYEESSWFDHSWAMRALVRMPPGSPLPSTTAADTAVTLINDDSTDVYVEVSVLEPNGRQ